MQTKPLIAALAVAALAFPFTTNAGTDKATSANASSTQSTTASAATTMFSSLDKNGDGFISKDEAKGTPHEADFASLDRNGDGKLSPDEHANAQVAAQAKTGSTGSTASTANGKKTY